VIPVAVVTPAVAARRIEAGVTAGFMHRRSAPAIVPTSGLSAFFGRHRITIEVCGASY
jgi:hypothetical protein